MKIFVAGSLNMDLTIRAPYMPQKGETLGGSGFLVTPGGKGANQAVALSRLGAKTYMVGCVGGAFGAELVSSLQKSGVNTQFVSRVEEVSSGIAVIVVIDGDNRIILDRGANAKVTKEQIDCALQNAEAGDYLVVQLEIDPDIVAYALRKAKEKGMVTVLNPAPAAALPDDMLSNSDYFIPNQSEAEFYTGIYPEDEESAKACAVKLREKGVKNVLITMGEQGSVCISDEEYVRADIVKVNAIDTTAAGDTYVGAFVTKISEGASKREAMRFASAASAVTVTRRGAQASIPAREEVNV